MPPYALDLLIPVLYLCIALWCFVKFAQGYKSHELLFKRGTKGTNLKNNEFLIWVQIIGILLLGIGLSVYACIYLSLILPKVLSS